MLTKEQNKNVKKLVKALRSGNYSQKRSQLKGVREGVSSYCCLGVACDISGLGDWISETYEYIDINGFSCAGSGTLGNLNEVRKMFGFDSPFGSFVSKEDVGEDIWNTVQNDNETVVTLSQLNDAGVSFPVIAGIIERWAKRNESN